MERKMKHAHVLYTVYTAQPRRCRLGIIMCIPTHYSKIIYTSSKLFYQEENVSLLARSLSLSPLTLWLFVKLSHRYTLAL